MNGYSRYKEKSIYSMSSSEQLLLLFDEAISRLSRADYSLTDKNYPDFEDCITRVNRIVRYLIEILDMDQPISRDLRRIYNYLVYDLSIVKAGRERRRDEIGRIRHILSELRGAFGEASKQVSDMHIIKETEIRG
ncbi:MAG: flagellar protein FliS [Lachnospiraceae bacterium]|nr:flagellar protein FliS [Lachnospiraceae bacterium]